MIYTVRYAHLANVYDLKCGHILSQGARIGLMGNTGQSTGAHLHIDCVEGLQLGPYSLQMIDEGNPKSALRQLNYFIDDTLFNSPIAITTYYGDPEYQTLFKKVHHGYDVVPKSRLPKDFTIYWNRSKPGRVTNIKFDKDGYGTHVFIAFEG